MAEDDFTVVELDRLLARGETERWTPELFSEKQQVLVGLVEKYGRERIAAMMEELSTIRAETIIMAANAIREILEAGRPRTSPSTADSPATVTQEETEVNDQVPETDSDDPAVEAARALSRSAIFANGFSSVAVSEAVAANAGALDRDQLLKVVRLLTARLAMFSRTLGEFIEQIPNRQVERMAALNQMNGFWEQTDYDW